MPLFLEGVPMKATKKFAAVKPGEVYPTIIEAGEEGPAELEAAAKAMGAAPKAKAMKKAPETK